MLKKLDRQIALYKDDLIRHVGLSDFEAMNVASLVEKEIFSDGRFQNEYDKVSPVPIESRYEELIAFQQWTDNLSSKISDPYTTRTRVISQCYICFVYLKDACFEILNKWNTSLVATRCAIYLSNGKVRDFRNAFSHANWYYSQNNSYLICWVKENSRDPSSLLRKFIVPQAELDFWQTLSRGIAYTVFLSLKR